MLRAALVVQEKKECVYVLHFLYAYSAHFKTFTNMKNQSLNDFANS